MFSSSEPVAGQDLTKAAANPSRDGVTGKDWDGAIGGPAPFAVWAEPAWSPRGARAG